MSLVNQVLNDLEKRGVNVTQADASIRAVPPRKQRNWMPYALAALILLILGTTAKWYFGREGAVAVEPAVVANVPQYELVPGISDAAAASMPVSAVPVAEPVAEVIETPVVEALKKPAGRPSAQPRGNSPNEQADSSDAFPTNLPIKVISPQQRAESEFSKANLAVQEGRINDALAGYENALLSDPNHKASRRAWVNTLLGLKRNEEAERVLQRGLRRDPRDASFAMLLARLQVERNAIPAALETLQKNLPDAADQADYQAFMAALLQRQDRHQEAVGFFQKALTLSPNNGVWLTAMGISLQAALRNEEARAAYQRALDTRTLNPQLQEFVQQKLKAL
ncbi:MAG: tetratricopeptide repeat protein [Nitrosomonadales bacterium]|nr:tetratricopeptide repeat protein [Nitrosomonadales bacterium]